MKSDDVESKLNHAIRTEMVRGGWSFASSSPASGCFPAFDSYSNPGCEFLSTVDVGTSWDPLTASLVAQALIHGLPGKQCVCLTERVMRYEMGEMEYGQVAEHFMARLNGELIILGQAARCTLEDLPLLLATEPGLSDTARTMASWRLAHERPSPQRPGAPAVRACKTSITPRLKTAGLVP